MDNLRQLVVSYMLLYTLGLEQTLIEKRGDVGWLVKHPNFHVMNGSPYRHRDLVAPHNLSLRSRSRLPACYLQI